LSACADNNLRIALLAGGRLDPAEEGQLRAHLTACAGCAGELAAEEDLSRRLDGLPRPAAPDDLRAKVQKILRARRAPRPLLRMVSRRLLAAGAVAAVLIVATALVLRFRSAGDPLTLAARQAVAEHQRIDAHRDLLAAETAGAPLRLRELAQQYGLPTATAFPGDADLQLVSARPGSVLGKVSATLVYMDKQARLVTLDILPGKDVQIPPDRTRKVQQFRPVLTRVEPCGVVLWKQEGSLYVLTAKLDDQDLAGVFVKVRTHRT
jgi:anti-sigma factor RsiW